MKLIKSLWAHMPVLILRKTKRAYEGAAVTGIERIDELLQQNEHLNNRIAELRDDRVHDKRNIGILCEQVIQLTMGYNIGSVVTHFTSSVPVVVRKFSLSAETGDILVRAEWLHADLNGIEKRWVTYPAKEMIPLEGFADEPVEVEEDDE
jgi:hypothetical protein